MKWFTRMLPLVQMETTLIPRCCRLWAVRRWRYVKSQCNRQIKIEEVSSSSLLIPVCSASHQVRQEGLQGSAAPAASDCQQCHYCRGGQTQAAHRVWSSERSEVNRWMNHLLNEYHWTPDPIKLSVLCRYLSQLPQWRPVCSARAQWRQQTEGWTDFNTAHTEVLQNQNHVWYNCHTKHPGV